MHAAGPIWPTRLFLLARCVQLRDPIDAVLATTSECAFRPCLTITIAVRIHRLFANFDCKYLQFSRSTQFTIDRVEKDWIFPGEAQCMQCHTTAAGFALGPETAQLNKDFTYPSTAITANQLATLDHIVAFASPLPATPNLLPLMPDPTDSSVSLNDRARAYLHTNCAQCHQASGPTPVDLDFRFTTSLANTNACDAAPQAGDLGLANPRIIAPGDAARSILVARANARDSDGMPPLGSAIPDAAGVTLLTSWVNGLASCN
jgi:mono/diheme cytochrome c family protein